MHFTGKTVCLCTDESAKNAIKVFLRKKMEDEQITRWGKRWRQWNCLPRVVLAWWFDQHTFAIWGAVMMHACQPVLKLPRCRLWLLSKEWCLNNCESITYAITEVCHSSPSWAAPQPSTLIRATTLFIFESAPLCSTSALPHYCPTYPL